MQSALPPQPPPPPMRIRPLSLSASSRATQTYMCGGLSVGWLFYLTFCHWSNLANRSTIKGPNPSNSWSISRRCGNHFDYTTHDGSVSTWLINFQFDPSFNIHWGGIIARGVFDLWSKGAKLVLLLLRVIDVVIFWFVWWEKSWWFVDEKFEAVERQPWESVMPNESSLTCTSSSVVVGCCCSSCY